MTQARAFSGQKAEAFDRLRMKNMVLVLSSLVTAVMEHWIDVKEISRCRLGYSGNRQMKRIACVHNDKI